MTYGYQDPFVDAPLVEDEAEEARPPRPKFEEPLTRWERCLAVGQVTLAGICLLAVLAAVMLVLNYGAMRLVEWVVQK